MGKKRWIQIAESFQERQQTRAGMMFLQRYGISANLAMKICKLYGERTQTIVA